MEHSILKKYVDEDMSIRQISNQTKKSPTTVRYWLNKYELKTNHQSIKEREIVDYNGFRKCPTCKTEKPITEYYNRRDKIGSGSHCKSCIKTSGRDRAREFKKKCVEYKGGKCEKCGYDKYIGAFDFHHINPLEKEYGISKVKHNTFNEKIKNELDKCILLCANCHREIHNEE